MTSPDDLTPGDDILGSLLAGREPALDDGGRDPHAGHAHAQGATADVSVRPAIPEDAPLIGALQARSWRAALADLLPAESLAALDADAFTASWHAAITAPPSPEHRVLTACAGAEVVGFVAFAPAAVDEAAVDEAAPGATRAGAGAEILSLEVDVDHTREGHGSRLLAACADTVRDGGGTKIQTWARDGDEARTRFLSSAGFAPAGVRRTLDVPDARAPLVEIAWYAAL
ncbi:GNAT family N-acetyltransferase [Georgenia wangjunii]|uniref:GNAT family N-acetyltransferase n=1 Tax=Georgenia wangjunii TaxID=3117730 RepID=UPI002F2618BF